VREQLKRVPGLVLTVRAARRGRVTARRSAEDARFALARRRRQGRIEEYLRTHPVRRLQLGTGSNPYHGWLNTDVVDYRRRNEVVYLDAREPFPLPDNAFDTAFSEHMIEHLTYADGMLCLRECHRVLRPDGRLRIATPSLRRIAALYAEELTDLQRRYLAWATGAFVKHSDIALPGFVLNNIARNFEHKFVYDEETLRHVLAVIGFVEITEWPVGESADPALTGLERHMRSAAEFNAYETLVLEARKPRA